MIVIENWDGEEELLKPLNELGKEIDKTYTPITGKDLELGLLCLRQSAYNYGIVNAEEEQHLGLLYFWIAQIRDLHADPSSTKSKQRAFEEKEALEHSKWEDEHFSKGWFKLAILGGGASAAYYLSSLGRAYDHKYTAHVATPDPWQPSDVAPSRGEGTVNHENHLIGQWTGRVPRFGTTYVPRGEFAEQNREWFKLIPGPNRFETEVTAIRRGVWGFTIDLANGRTIFAKKVIAALGAGPHTDRGLIRNDAPPERVMDLDTFMRKHPPDGDPLGDQTCVVSGPNAGIDAVERAGERGFGRVFWMMSQSSNPVLLPGNRLRYAPRTPPTKTMNRDEHEKRKIASTAAARNITELAADDGGKIKMTYLTPENEVVVVTDIDYFVYALGQNPSAPGAVLSVIHPTLIALLEPIYDRQNNLGRYTMFTPPPLGEHDDDPADPEGFILGFQTEGTTSRDGLQIIGAAAESIAYNSDGRTVRCLGDKRRQDEIKNKLVAVAKAQPATVAQFGQLGGTKSSIGVLNSLLPEYVTREVNFSTDDRTVIRTHIAIKYPNIKETDARRIIDAILAHRRSDGDRYRGFHPLGYDAWWQMHWHHMLEWWNAPSEKREEISIRQNLEVESLEDECLGQQSGFWTG